MAHNAFSRQKQTFCACFCRASLVQYFQRVKKVFLTRWWTGEQAIHNSQWSPCCAWRLAAFPPLSSAWSLRIVRKLTRGAPCFTGLIGGYCTLNSQWSSCCALRLAVLPPLSSAWSPLCVRKAHLRCFLLHWAHRRLLQPLAAPPLSPSLGLLRAVSFLN